PRPPRRWRCGRGGRQHFPVDGPSPRSPPRDSRHLPGGVTLPGPGSRPGCLTYLPRDDLARLADALPLIAPCSDSTRACTSARRRRTGIPSAAINGSRILDAARIISVSSSPRVGALAAIVGAEVATDVQLTLADSDIDAVDICVPTSFHREVAE